VRLIVVVAVSAFLWVPASAPTSAAGAPGYEARQHTSDVSAAKKKKKAKKTAPKQEQYLRAVPSEPPPGARR
jgi:hypothetical protein